MDGTDTGETRLGEGTLVVRRARPADRPAILRLTADLRAGTDYVPFVLDRWLDDRHGILQVAVLDGRVVGFQHGTLQPEGDAWLEGIRIADEERGKGIGGLMLAAGLEWARMMGAEQLALLVGAGNGASNRVAERDGLDVLARFHRVRAPRDEKDRGTRVAAPGEYEAVRAVVAEGVYYTEGWTAYRLTERRLRLLLARQAVLVHGGAALDAAGIVTANPEDGTPRLGFITGTADGMEAIARAVRGLGPGGAGGLLHLDDRAQVALSMAGYELGAELLVRGRSLSQPR